MHDLPYIKVIAQDLVKGAAGITPSAGSGPRTVDPNLAFDLLLIQAGFELRDAAQL